MGSAFVRHGFADFRCSQCKVWMVVQQWCSVEQLQVGIFVVLISIRCSSHANRSSTFQRDLVDKHRDMILGLPDIKHYFLAVLVKRLQTAKRESHTSAEVDTDSARHRNVGWYYDWFSRCGFQHGLNRSMRFLQKRRRLLCHDYNDGLDKLRRVRDECYERNVVLKFSNAPWKAYVRVCMRIRTNRAVPLVVLRKPTAPFIGMLWWLRVD
jgi:hypothetical protein